MNSPVGHGDPVTPPGPCRTSLRELALLFLRLGTTAFGGPAAHIAMMEDEVVHRRRWLEREEFLDLLGATNLIPGPNSTELAIHIGHRRAGWAGLLVAGSCFILPAFFIVMAIAWAYVRFGALPETAALLYGVKPVVMAVVVQALWRLGKSALKTGFLAVVALVTVALSFLGINELLILFGAGVVVALVRSMGERRRQGGAPLTLFAAAPAVPIAKATAAAAAPFGLWPLFLFFLKVGSWVRALRQRLCAPCVPACRPRGTVAVADR
jgi:chromate transporter